MHKLILWASVSLSAANLLADDGRLPRGQMQTNPEFVPPATTSNIASESCATYNASPIYGLYYLSPSNEYLYVLVKNPNVQNGRVVNDPTQLNHYDFYRLNFIKFEWDLLMSFSKGDISVILPHGKYTDGISFLTFSEFQDGCYFGNAGGFSATLGEDYRTVERNVASKKFAYGRYKVLPSSLGRTVADMTKRSIIEIDPNFFQRRATLNFEENHVPIYLDYESRRLVTYNQNTNPHQLELKLENAKEAYKKMPLSTNQKFVSEGSQFAKMHYEANGKRVIIHTTQEWTQVKENLYKLNLPGEFSADTISIYPRFINNTAVVLGINESERKRLRVALVVDLAKNRVVHRHVPKPGFYVSFATMGPYGKYAYFIVNYTDTGAFHKLFRYDLNKKYYRVLSPFARSKGITRIEKTDKATTTPAKAGGDNKDKKVEPTPKAEDPKPKKEPEKK